MLTPHISEKVDVRNELNQFVDKEFGQRLGNARRSETLKRVVSILSLPGVARMTMLFRKKQNESKGMKDEIEKSYSLMAKSYFPNHAIPNDMTARTHCLNILTEIKRDLKFSEDFDIKYIMLALVGRLQDIPKIAKKDKKKLSGAIMQKLIAVGVAGSGYINVPENRNKNTKNKIAWDASKVALILRKPNTVIEFYKKLGDKLDERKGDVFTTAAENESLAVLQYLYERYGRTIGRDKIEEEVRKGSLSGKFSVVQFLFEKYGNIFGDPHFIKSPFFYALNTAHMPLVEYLFEHFDNVINVMTKHNVFKNMAITNNLALTEYFYKKCRGSIHFDTMVSVLRAASESGQLPIVEFFHKQLGAYMSDNDKVQIFWDAGKNGHLEVVKYLLEVYGTAIRANIKRTVQRIASENGHVAVAEYLQQQIDSAPALAQQPADVTPAFNRKKRKYMQISDKECRNLEHEARLVKRRKQK